MPNARAQVVNREQGLPIGLAIRAERLDNQ